MSNKLRYLKYTFEVIFFMLILPVILTKFELYLLVNYLGFVKSQELGYAVLLGVFTICALILCLIEEC